MDEQTLQDPYDLRDSDSTPVKIPLTPELNQYLVAVIKSVLITIKSKTDLNEIEKLIGQGTDHWPKDNKPVTLRIYDKLRTKRFSIVFERKNNNLPWFQAELTVFPRNYPRSVYMINQSNDIFENFVLDKSFAEDRPTSAIKRVNIFQFHLKNSTVPIKLQAEAREDVSSLNDKYPQSFHYLRITREGE